jgi:ParB family transcriptional regulator, chromosome partitioning protein
MQKKAALQTTNGPAAGVARLFPLATITPSTRNVRQSFDEKGLAELTASIKKMGVLQPILVRPLATKGKQERFEIVAGERRWRAAEAAGLTEIPAHIKVMSDAEALDAQLIENLQREHLHPLDEAAGFLRLKDERQLNVRAIAARLGKDARYVARRLALNHLIPEACADYRAEHLELAHALELCRLAPEIQHEALAACYETKWEGNEAVPDKTRPARHVLYLQNWLRKNVHLNLARAPFLLEDARLREDGLTCLNCPQRTGRDKTLFADLKESGVCLNPFCFQAKVQSYLGLRQAEVAAKQGKPAALLSTHYAAMPEAGAALGRNHYQTLAKKADRCVHAEQAVYADGLDLGKVQWICRDPACPDHLARVPETPQYVARGGNGNVSEPATRHERKQELFDMRVDEAVRKRVMAEALKTFTWPLDRPHLNEIAKEFFRRLPSDDAKTVGGVFDWNEEVTSQVRFDDRAVLRELAKLDDNRLAQFLLLCSFAHYGANRDEQRQVEQAAIVRLSEECGVNHKLIDAEVRAELCPKKYKDAHRSYLESVKRGKAKAKPVVYEAVPLVTRQEEIAHQPEQIDGQQ